MRALVFVVAVFPLGALSAETATATVCLLQESVAISEVSGQIELAGAPDRLASIRVQLPVDCKTGSQLVPNDYREAIEWLDIGLPMDLKAALLDGEYADPFRASSYGASVMRDLHAYVGQRWKLSKESRACAAPIIQARSEPDETPCFYVLVDLLRETYLSRGNRWGHDGTTD